MNLKLDQISSIKDASIQVTGSKSETNRLLILQAFYPEIDIVNASNSDDSKLMKRALADTNELVDIHHAGTAMRFLTGYYAVQDGKKTILTGSSRMQERPIKILVEALRQLGCSITYQKKEGYPPLLIEGKNPSGNLVSLSANISSQYISSLMLIAPSLPDGLTIALEGNVTSVPYIKMTLNLLRDIGVEGVFRENVITIKPTKVVTPKSLTVESDWSSASYFYSIVALSQRGTVDLMSYKNPSYQGDSILAEVYKQLGVSTFFEGTKITLSKIPGFKNPERLELDLSNAPDIAQTIAVTCFGMGISCYLTGLHTLKIKETDRLQALKNEIEKLGGKVAITDATLTLDRSKSILPNTRIATYKDHRMAMAFAPLALKTPLHIEQANVVSKSYPDFWSDLNELGFKFSEIK